MAVTRAQVNTGKAVILDRLVTHDQNTQFLAVRAAVHFFKNGNATQKEVAKVCLREWYQAIFGADPATDAQAGHVFRQHWLHDVLEVQDGQLPVDLGDRFDAEAIVVT